PIPRYSLRPAPSCGSLPSSHRPLRAVHSYRRARWRDSSAARRPATPASGPVRERVAAGWGRPDSDGTGRSTVSGHELDFDDIVRRYRRELHVYCYRMLGSLEEAEDHVQEVFVRAWRSLGSFQGRASARTWLYRIATNACLDTLRRDARRAAGARVGA